MKKTQKIILGFIAITLMAITFLTISNDSSPYAKATITQILSTQVSETAGRKVGSEELEIKITSGPYQNEIMTLTHYMSIYDNVQVKKGSKIIVRLLENDEGNTYASMFNLNRSTRFLLILLLFLVSVIVVSGKQGVIFLGSMLIILGNIVLIYIPTLIAGYSPVFITFVTFTLCASLILILNHGLNFMTLILFILNLVGFVVLLVVNGIMNALFSFDGYALAEAENMVLAGTQIQIEALWVSASLVMGLGIMFVLTKKIYDWRNQEILGACFLQQGYAFVNEMLGSVLLFGIGSRLSMWILIQLYDLPLLQLWNTNEIMMIFVQFFSLAFSLYLTVPLFVYLLQQAKVTKRVQDKISQ